MAEAEFLSCRYEANGPACFATMMKVLPAEVASTIQGTTAGLTAANPAAYILLAGGSHGEVYPYTSPEVLEHPTMVSRSPLDLYHNMHCLLPLQGDILLKAMYLQCLHLEVHTALADKGDLPPAQLAQAALRVYNQLLPATIATFTAAAMAAIPAAPPASAILAAATSRQRSP